MRLILIYTRSGPSSRKTLGIFASQKALKWSHKSSQNFLLDKTPHAKYNYHMILLILAILSAPVQANETYYVVGYEHISSPFVGPPLNRKKEITLDMAYIGVRHKRKNWTFSADVAHLIKPDKNNPRTIFRIEKRWR